MVLVQLNGGLGNQLFQYALGRKIALDRNTVPRFETSAFRTQSREYKLHHYQVKGSPATEKEVRRFLGWEQNPWLKKVYRLYNSKRPYYRRVIVDEQSVPFDKNILKVPKNVFLRGYWQSEKYFHDIAEILRQDLVLKTPLSGLNREMAKKIQTSLSVSLHVRHGDYATDMATHQTHGLLSLDYYRAAISHILALFPDASFFLFSDDIPWIRENLKINATHCYVDHNTDQTDFEDLRLMSLCKHHIIANSSFSWWGAWLCQNPEKVVVAPRQWYRIEIDTRDLVPKDWIRL
ncbi:MAG TPA: alpha-1,2-fucosyltransferase [Anaerolineales bacterium]|nr:alpha-1,2-fucosyltransferase [Anaerolineales bacterium]